MDKHIEITDLFNAEALKPVDMAHVKGGSFKRAVPQNLQELSECLPGTDSLTSFGEVG